MMFWKLDKGPGGGSYREPEEQQPKAFYEEQPPSQPVYERTARAYDPGGTGATTDPFEVPRDYEQGARKTMRFLAEQLAVPVWVLLRNNRGILSVIEGFGDYRRFLVNSSFPVSRLPELPTINLLGASLPRFPSFERARGTSAGDARTAYIDPETLAPYGIPLLHEDGSLFGILCAFGERIDTDQLERSRTTLLYAASMLANAVRSDFALEETMRRADRAAAEALLDPLTTLYNRRGWDDLLNGEEQRAAKHYEDAAVFLVDLDNLKAINDTYGHESGDGVIKAAADALRNSVRGSDVVSRIGGDEFAVLAIKCDRMAAPRVCSSMQAALQRSNVAATIGYAVRSEAGTLFEAQRRADAEMYARKNSRRDRGVPAVPEAPRPQPPPQAAPPTPQAAQPQPVPHHTPHPEPAHNPAPDTAQPSQASVFANVLETMLPAILAKLYPRETISGVPVPGVTPAAAQPQQWQPPAPDVQHGAPAYTPQPQPPQQAIPEPPVRQAEPQRPSSPPPSNDLIEIVSRLRALSDSDRRLLDAFLRGGE